MFYRDNILNEAGGTAKMFGFTYRQIFRDAVDITPEENVPVEFIDTLIDLTADMRKSVYKQEKENKVLGIEPKLKRDKAKGKIKNSYNIPFASNNIRREGQEEIIRRAGFKLGQEVKNKKTKWHGKNLTNYGNWLYKLSSDKQFIYAITLMSTVITTTYYGAPINTTFQYNIIAFCLDNTEENQAVIM